MGFAGRLRYVFSDPVNLIDPEGEFAVIAIVGFVVVVGALTGYVTILTQKRRNAEGPAKNDAYISGDPNRIKAIHERISRTNKLSKAIPVTVKIALIPGRGIPKNTKESFLELLNRLYLELKHGDKLKSKKCP